MADLTALALKAKLAALAKNPPAKPVKIGAGGGLYLLVKPGQTAGTGAWVLRLTAAGKRRDMGLGAFPVVGLADARVVAMSARQKAAAGTDPVAERKAARAALVPEAPAITFKAAALATMEARQGGWSNPRHAAQWLASLTHHAFPKLAARPINAIDTAAVLEVLRPIWTEIPETASRLRGRMETIMDVAKLRGWRHGENPARWKGHLAEELPSPKKVQRVEHRPALPWQGMPAFVAALDTMEGLGAMALRFTILTASRTGEVRGMRWREVDMDNAVWAVPPARMKARRLHRVPLSGSALSILAALRPMKPESDALVFPGGRASAPLSDMTLSAVVRRMNGLAEAAALAAGQDAGKPRWCDLEGRAVVPHGFRSSFRDWAGETRSEGREVVERALAHTIKNKAEAAYARSDLLEKRRVLMEAWAQHCGRSPATVASLNAARAGRAVG